MTSFDTLRTPLAPINMLTAYRRAILSQLQPAMLGLAILPVLVAALLWGVAFWLFWGVWLGWTESLLVKLPWVGGWFAHSTGQAAGWAAALVAGTLGLFSYVLAVLVSSLMFVSVFGTALMLRHVAPDYPDVKPLGGGSVAGSAINSLKAVAGFVVLAAVTLPLWFIPVIGWIIPVILLGLLNARVLRYDVLANHASAEELQALAQAPDLHWRWLGFFGALSNVVPVLWFFSTTITGLAFIHYGLAELTARRLQLSGKTGS